MAWPAPQSLSRHSAEQQSALSDVFGLALAFGAQSFLFSAFACASAFSRSTLAVPVGEIAGTASAAVAITANPNVNRMTRASAPANRAMFASLCLLYRHSRPY